MSIKILENLFNSKIRPTVLKVFFANPSKDFDIKEIVKFSKISKKAVEAELNKLTRIGILKKKIQKRKRYYFLNEDFIFKDELEKMFLKLQPLLLKEIENKIKKIKGIELCILSGYFLKTSSPVDLLIVGRNISQLEISRLIKKLEVDASREFFWSYMSEDEFKLRLQMNDKFIREILSRPHLKVVNKISFH
ncbi:MAG: hypothetical protein PHO31_01265 [Candidatus Pacebacteria bacterium]|nr:hypothetical protein [Candidatus Paceibacterota bacterium]